ncbi:hypothetical protein ABZ342_44620 [Amycolatopsis sp. NPDC005961]|uniref:hypothetical protein n=1 Tax=Amycolatopsis sp. NPDC005961 TaxID=3156720 RepID=UPI0033FE8E27
MTALDAWQQVDAPGEWWEWHGFVDGLAHLYPHAQLQADWPIMVRPACEEDQPHPLGHDRPSITRDRVRPAPERKCPDCLSQTTSIASEVPHARRR